MSDKRDRSPSIQKDSTSANNLQQTMQTAFQSTQQTTQTAAQTSKKDSR